MRKLKTNKILITGCFGVIGIRLIQRMTKLGLKFDGLDIIQKKITFLSHRSKIFCFDLSNLKKTRNIVQNYDGVIHLAGFSRVQECKCDPFGAIKSNIVCTANILESARSSPKKPWVLLASSLEVITNPKGAYGFTNMYGITKAVAELLAHRYVLDQGIRAGAARIAGVYGSLEDQPSKVPMIFVKHALENRDIEVLENSRKMNYIHIDDVCRELINAARRLCKSKKPVFYIFKIHSNQKITLKNLVKKIIKITRSKSNVKLINNTQKKNLPTIKNIFLSKNKRLKRGLIELVSKIKKSKKHNRKYPRC